MPERGNAAAAVLPHSAANRAAILTPE